MSASHARFVILLSLLGCLPAVPAAALLLAVYAFSTGDPDGKMATASRPNSNGNFEIETGDDFILTTTTSITGATFTGLLTGDGGVSKVRVEIYRVFPNDSSDPPSGNVPTRVNSPSDVAFLEADSATGGLRFSTNELAAILPSPIRCSRGASIPNRTRRPAGTAQSKGRKWSSM